METDPDIARTSVDTQAQAYARAWRQTAAKLEPRRLEALRRLSELEAAQHFARLLTIPLPYPVREGSGLVEQQRIFDRLRKTPVSFGPILDAALAAQAAYESIGSRGCVIGGVALQRWGEPRFTAGADLSVLVAPGDEAVSLRPCSRG